jgi:hypothetical protein
MHDGCELFHVHTLALLVMDKNNYLAGVAAGVGVGAAGGT